MLVVGVQLAQHGVFVALASVLDNQPRSGHDVLVDVLNGVDVGRRGNEVGSQDVRGEVVEKSLAVLKLHAHLASH